MSRQSESRGRTAAAVFRWGGLAASIVVMLSAGLPLAPPAAADPAANIRSAVASGRAGTSCPPLHSNPVVDQAADIINQSTEQYMDHTATHVPISDPLPGLQDLGYSGSKAALLQGAHRNEADAIKGALLQGYATIPDCSYTDFGVSMRRNEPTGYNLAVLVLAGP